jgi:hypothetical protein
LQELKKAFRKDIHAIRVAAMFEIVRRTNKLAKHGFSKKIETTDGLVSVGILRSYNPWKIDTTVTKEIIEAG